MKIISSLLIDTIGNEPKQNIPIQLGNGEILNLYLWFSPVCNCWFMNITYNDFILNGLQIVYSKNILIQYENILPFGIEIASKTGLDPLSLDSFSNELNVVIINEYEI